MCGIAGFVSTKHDCGQAVNIMCQAMHHRGPDQNGRYNDSTAPISLGHQRLSIIDLSERARQPMSDESGQFQLVFNGEIYNYLQVRQNLQNLGHTFHSGSDSEVLLRSFIEWGEACLERLNGMFAFAIYDTRNKKIFIARDKIGEKPIYYLHENGVFAFASEFKSLAALRSIGFSLTLDPISVQTFFGFMWQPDSSRTMVQEIARLEPGHTLTYCLNNNSLVKKQYWRLKADPNISRLSYEDACERYGEILEESVRLRLQADVPLAVMLSGGLDSSLIAAVARPYVDKLRTFTLTFNHEKSEAQYAEIVARHLSTNHEFLHIDQSNIMAEIKDSIPYFDDLSTVDGGLITTRLACKKLKERGVRVILLGEGSDEINAGYQKFSFSKLPFSAMPPRLAFTFFYYAMSRFSPTWKGFFQNRDVGYKFLDIAENCRLQQYTRFDIEHQLPNHLLMKVDKATMSESIEARVPFLDPDLATFVFSLPAEYKLSGKWFNPWMQNEKKILRDVAKAKLPKEIIDRRKFGMMLPISDTVRSNQDEMFEEIISANSFIPENLISKNFMKKLFQPSKFGYQRTQRESFIWKLFIFSLWAKEYRFSFR